MKDYIIGSVLCCMITCAVIGLADWGLRCEKDRDKYKQLYESSTNKEASVRKVLVYSVKKCRPFADFLQDVLQRQQNTRVALLRNYETSH